MTLQAIVGTWGLTALMVSISAALAAFKMGFLQGCLGHKCPWERQMCPCSGARSRFLLETGIKQQWLLLPVLGRNGSITASLEHHLQLQCLATVSHERQLPLLCGHPDSTQWESLQGSQHSLGGWCSAGFV